MFWLTTAVSPVNKIKTSHRGTRNTTFKVQVTLEHHGFELCRDFFSIHTTVLHDLQLVEPTDAEQQVQGADCKVTAHFPLRGVSTPNPYIVQGSTVFPIL